MLFTILGFYVLGIMSGILILNAYATTQVPGSFTKAKELADKVTSLADRMKRVRDIAEEQLDLYSRSNGPQKNAMDGKYKNDLMSKIQSLDDEKMVILRSILSDGHDPELSTMDEAGVVTKMRLSQYLGGMPVENKEPKASSKFTIFRGGKDDGNNTTH